MRSGRGAGGPRVPVVHVAAVCAISGRVGQLSCRSVQCTTFDTFSIDFAGPLPMSKEGNRYMLIAVGHLTKWPIAVATKTATTAEVIRFVNEEIIYSFGPPKTIISDNANAFTVTALVEFLAKSNIGWRTVLAYAPMSIGKAERMVGTIKRAIRKTLPGKDRLLPNGKQS